MPLGDSPPPLRRARVGEVDLAFRMGGEGRPVLLIHGSWEDHHAWDAVSARLRERCTVVAYDRRGHSASTAPPGQGRIGEDVDDAAALIAHLGLGPTTVVGHSFGATAALMVAMSHPESAACVIAHEPPLFGQITGDPAWDAERIAALETMAAVAAGLEAGEIEASVRHFIDDVAFGKGAWENLFDERGRAIAISNSDTWLDQSRDPDRFTVDLSPLRDTAIPITVTAGTAGFPVYPEIARRVVAALPSAQLVEIAGAAHGVQHSHPEEFARVIVEQVQQL